MPLDVDPYSVLGSTKLHFHQASSDLLLTLVPSHPSCSNASGMPCQKDGPSHSPQKYGPTLIGAHQLSEVSVQIHIEDLPG